jgi:hypothetical protein
MAAVEAGTYYETLMAGLRVPELEGDFYMRHAPGPSSDGQTSTKTTDRPVARHLRLLGFKLRLYKSADMQGSFDTIDLRDLLPAKAACPSTSFSLLSSATATTAATAASSLPAAEATDVPPSTAASAANQHHHHYQQQQPQRKSLRRYSVPPNTFCELVTLRQGTFSFEMASRAQATLACCRALRSFKSITTVASIVYVPASSLFGPMSLGGGGGSSGSSNSSRSSSSSSSTASSSKKKRGQQQQQAPSSAPVLMFACLRGSRLQLFSSRQAVLGEPSVALDLANLRSVKQQSLQTHAAMAGGFDLIFCDGLHTLLPVPGSSADAVASQHLCTTLATWQSKQMLHISELKKTVAYMRFELQRHPEHGFGMIVTRCPSVEVGPAWPGKFLEHLRVTTLSRPVGGGGGLGPAELAGMRLNDAILTIENVGNDGGVLRTLSDVGVAVKGKDRIVVEVARLPLEHNVADPAWASWNDPRCVRACGACVRVRACECVRAIACESCECACARARVCVCVCVRIVRM